MPFTTAQYRQVLAAALGFYSPGLLADGAGSSNSLVCSGLIDSDFEANFLDGTWILTTSSASGTPTSGTVRRVKTGGLAPATGTVTMTRTFGTSAISSGFTFDIYGVLPPTDQLGRRGILSCINLALRECWILDYLSITGVANQYQYPLSTSYPWLTSEDQVIDVWVRRPSYSRDQMTPEWRFISDADSPQLEFKVPFTTSDTLKPYVYRPLDTWISVHGGGFAESTVGLVNDDDQALLSLDGMKAVGLYYCYESLAMIGDASERASWQALASRQRILANAWKRANLRRDTGREMHWRNTFSTLAPAFPLEGSLGPSDGV